MERGTALVPPMEDVLFSIGTCLSWKKMSSRLLTVSERGREGGREGGRGGGGEGGRGGRGGEGGGGGGGEGGREGGRDVD